MQSPPILRLLSHKALSFGLSLLLLGGAQAAPRPKVLHTFLDKPLRGPKSNLVFDRSSNIYGATAFGGHQGCTDGCGGVFQLSPNSDGGWSYQVIYQFHGKDDGGNPLGNVVLDRAGNLYGVTELGHYNCGNVFQLSWQGDAWKETTIYSFTCGSDGSQPYAGLTIDSSDNLYGTTSIGGAYGDGTVYELTPTSNGWSETVLHSFSCVSEGCNPNAGIFIDREGNLYSTTIFGGQDNNGSVFELTPNGKGGWNESVLYPFGSAAGVIVDSANNIYGVCTIPYDGAGAATGCVFRLTKNSHGEWTLSFLHFFEGKNDGSYPMSDLTMDAAGDLFGTTYIGGKQDHGTIYELKPQADGKWKESVYLSLSFWDGAYAINPVTWDASGNLLVAIFGGGKKQGIGGWGVVLEVIP